MSAQILTRYKKRGFEIWFDGSLVRDEEGKPLVVYRGEHGNTRTGEEFSSLLASLSFGTSEVASEYALAPNVGKHIPIAPRVYPCYLRIVNPVLNNPNDAYMEFSDIEDKFGRNVAIRFAIRFSEYIEHTSNWGENYSEEYASVEELLRQRPETIRNLYMWAFPLLDDFEFVELAKSKGYDGAIHAGTAASLGTIEYKVFHHSQVKSAIRPYS
ncbi:MAG: ADP-ribosyltransferase-containing protein [Nitrososphaerales archaeon]